MYVNFKGFRKRLAFDFGLLGLTLEGDFLFRDTTVQFCVLIFSDCLDVLGTQIDADDVVLLPLRVVA